MNNSNYSNSTAVFYRVLGALLLAIVSTGVFAFDRDSFYAAVSKASEKYDRLVSSDEMRQLAIQGKSSESNRRLTALVADEDKTFYDYFILGNMLFRIDTATSDDYMKRAEALQPDNPMVLYERGIHEHKDGNFDAAATYYRRFHQSTAGKNNPVSWAYLTHAYLVTGKTESSFNAWANAGFDKNHITIEKAMYTLFSVSRQERKRESLVASIRAGNTDKFCDLWELDSNWEIDWWNRRPKSSYLAFDRSLAEEMLQPGSRDEQYFLFCSATDDLDDSQYLASLERLGIIGDRGQFPDTSALVYRVAQRLSASGLMTTAEFLGAYESQLRRYAANNPKDQRYYDVLAFLYANTGNQAKLKEIDMHGWKVLKADAYAASYIAGLDPESASYSSLLQEALGDFPNNVTLNQLNMRYSEQAPQASMAGFVAAQFANPQNSGTSGYRLGDYMLSLKHELASLQN
jgi:hypothetical protein